MFPTGAVLRTVAVVTGLLALWGCWTLFWLLVALVTGGEWSVARTAIATLSRIVWIGAWSLLTRRLWRAA